MPFLSSQLAAAYLEFLVDGDGEGVDGAGGGGGGAEHGRGREEQLKKAFQRVNLPVSNNQGKKQTGKQQNAVWGSWDEAIKNVLVLFMTELVVSHSL